MATYHFTKSGILKPYALDVYLTQNFSLYEDFSYSDPDLSIDTTATLNSAELEILTTLVENYTDPAVFLQLDMTINDASMSDRTSEPVLVAVNSFIFSALNPVGSSTFNALKVILEYSTNDIALFKIGSTEGTAVFQIYDYTRSVIIKEVEIDITSIFTAWQTAAQIESGPRYTLKTVMMEGLRNLVATTDCIWQFRLSISNANASVRTTGMQRLYYNLL